MSQLSAFGTPYGEPRHGVWGKSTSTLNFCEEDYVLSIYCAEVCNTLTNLIFIWLGIKGIRNCIKYAHPTVFLVAYVGYTVVGVGSALFHCTLKYPMQLVDELSMIYTTCVMCYEAFSFQKPPASKSLLAITLTCLALFITVYYHLTQNPVFHQTMYALLTAMVLSRCAWQMETKLRPRLCDGCCTNGTKCNGHRLMRQMWTLVAIGLTTFLGGFLLWILDNVFCAEVIRWRRHIGLPLAILLEGHAWWHILTGIGAYFYIVWGIWLRRCLQGEEQKYVLHWPRLFYPMPEVVSVARDSSEKID